jgi:hypothetical protein
MFQINVAPGPKNPYMFKKKTESEGLVNWSPSDGFGWNHGRIQIVITECSPHFHHASLALETTEHLVVRGLKGLEF